LLDFCQNFGEYDSREQPGRNSGDRSRVGRSDRPSGDRSRGTLTVRKGRIATLISRFGVAKISVKTTSAILDHRCGRLLSPEALEQAANRASGVLQHDSFA
jgi:hypothetical protein